MRIKSKILFFVTRACLVVALPALVCSCRDKDVQTASHTTAISREQSVAVDSLLEDQAMGIEEFHRQFVAILSEKGQLRSTLSEKVGNLCDNLDQQLLVQMLERAAASPPEGVGPTEWLFGHNQLMVAAANKLGAQAAGPFHQLAANEAAMPDMRDYAAQHYLRTEARILTDGLTGDETEKSTDHLRSVIENLKPLVGISMEREDSMPGTILLGLTALSMELDSQPPLRDIIREEATAMIIPVLEDFDHCTPPLRSSAMQAAARLGIQEAGPRILEVALNGGTSTMDRISAIGALQSYPTLLDEGTIARIPSNNEKVKFAKQRLIESRGEYESKQ